MGDERYCLLHPSSRGIARAAVSRLRPRSWAIFRAALDIIDWTGHQVFFFYIFHFFIITFAFYFILLVSSPPATVDELDWMAESRTSPGNLVT